MARRYGNARGQNYLVWRSKDVVGLTWGQVAKLFDISASRAQQIVYSERKRREGIADEVADTVRREDG